MEVTPAGLLLMKESSELQSCATLGTYLLSESGLLIDKLWAGFGAPICLLDGSHSPHQEGSWFTVIRQGFVNPGFLEYDVGV